MGREESRRAVCLRLCFKIDGAGKEGMEMKVILWTIYEVHFRQNRGVKRREGSEVSRSEK